ncbi:MAG: transposase, partial [bacterium]
MKLSLLQHHFELVRFLINEILDEEVESLCGQRYKHTRPYENRYSRWGTNPGSVKSGNQRIKIDVPRVYDKVTGSHISLENYRKLQELKEPTDQLSKAILCGLSMQDYGQVIETLLDSFGLSASTVSRQFVEQSSEKLKEFEKRSLHPYQFVALFIDGKRLAKEQIIIVLGVTESGDKLPIGFIQSHTENADSIKELLNELIERGLNYQTGLLCVIDGSKGIRKAVEMVFGDYVLIQRCQWHKRENVVSYLNEQDQKTYRKRLNKAYNCESYAEAKQQLLTIQRDLAKKNLSASRSLEEGLEETLTLHRLELHELFSRSFSTTNCIENLNSQLNKYIGKVKNWKTSTQRYRWIASALLEIEGRMRKV